jgi:hypothetical protein
VHSRRQLVGFESLPHRAISPRKPRARGPKTCQKRANFGSDRLLSPSGTGNEEPHRIARAPVREDPLDQESALVDVGCKFGQDIMINDARVGRQKSWQMRQT